MRERPLAVCVAGKNDGSVNAVRYFHARPHHGVFVRQDKLQSTAAATATGRRRSSADARASPLRRSTGSLFSPVTPSSNHASPAATPPHAPSASSFMKATAASSAKRKWNRFARRRPGGAARRRRNKPREIPLRPFGVRLERGVHFSFNSVCFICSKGSCGRVPRAAFWKRFQNNVLTTITELRRLCPVTGGELKVITFYQNIQIFLCCRFDHVLRNLDEVFILLCIHSYELHALIMFYYFRN